MAPFGLFQQMFGPVGPFARQVGRGLQAPERGGIADAQCTAEYPLVGTNPHEVPGHLGGGRIHA